MTDGLTDEVTNSLVGTPGLRVIARSSAFHFKGNSEDIRTIGRRLEADAVVEGSVRKSGNRLRVIVQVSSAADGDQVWSKSYDVLPGELAGLATDLSRAIADQLKVQLRSSAFLPRAGAAAHDLYLKGRYLWSRRTPDSLQKSVDYFNQAIAAQPNYALAYSGLANSYAVLASNGYRGAREYADKAKIAANQAIALDHTWFGNHHSRLLRHENALRELRVAHSLDPLSLMVSTNLAGTYIAMKKYDEAIAELRAALELDPNFLAAQLGLGVAYAESGNAREAFTEFTKAQAEEQIPLVSFEIYIDARTGQIRKARELLRQLEQNGQAADISQYDLAALHAVVGDNDRAFSLVASLQDDRPRLADIQLDTRFSKLHNDARYKAILRRVAFPF